MLVFLLLRLTPGDPAAILAGDAASSEQIAEIRASLGLDRSLPVQFGIWLGNMARGEKSGWFGWGKDDKIQELRAQFMRETDTGKKKKLAEAIQARAFEVATHVPLGEFDAPLAARKNVTGFFRQTGNFYWNIKKN